MYLLQLISWDCTSQPCIQPFVKSSDRKQWKRRTSPERFGPARGEREYSKIYRGGEYGVVDQALVHLAPVFYSEYNL